MISFHPQVVHFAVALFPLSVLFDILGLISGNQKYFTAARLNLIGSAAAVVAAVATGLLEKSRVQVPDAAGPAFEIHETMAFIITAMIIGLFLWRIAMKKGDWQRFRYYYLLVSFVAMLALFTGSWYGGKLVYQFGVGIENISVKAPNPQEIPSPETGIPRDNLFEAETDSVK